MKYNVDIKFTGYYSVDVEATSENEAIEKGRQMFRDCVFPDAVDDIETWNEDVIEID